MLTKLIGIDLITIEGVDLPAAYAADGKAANLTLKGEFTNFAPFEFLTFMTEPLFNKLMEIGEMMMF